MSDLIDNGRTVIRLTDKQFEQLQQLIEHAQERMNESKGGLILGQLSPWSSGGDRRVTFEFVEYPMSAQIIKIARPDVFERESAKYPELKNIPPIEPEKRI